MKKIILLLSIIATCFSVMGQDLIVKKNSESIKAKVLEVNQDDIKYKKWDNPDGPTYTISKADISSIVYQNGDAEAFNVEPKKSANTTSVKKDEYIEGHCSRVSFTAGDLKYDGYVIGNIEGLDNQEISKKIQDGELAYFYINNFYHYLKKYDVDSYKKFNQGSALQAVGITAMTLGAITAVGSAIAVPGLYEKYGMGNPNLWKVEVVIAAGAVLAVGIGLPMYFAGIKYYNVKVPEVYNNSAMRRNTSSLSYHIGVVGTGVGFSLKF